jgi:hypothetical protein
MRVQEGGKEQERLPMCFARSFQIIKARKDVIRTKINQSIRYWALTWLPALEGKNSIGQVYTLKDESRKVYYKYVEKHPGNVQNKGGRIYDQKQP